MLRTYAGNYCCQTLLFLTLVKHYWACNRWDHHIHNCRAAFSEAFSMGPSFCPIEISGRTPLLLISGSAPAFWKLTKDFRRASSSVICENWTKWCGYAAPVFCLKGSQTIYSHLRFTFRCVWVGKQQGQRHTLKSPYCKQRYLQIIRSAEWMSGYVPAQTYFVLCPHWTAWSNARLTVNLPPHSYIKGKHSQREKSESNKMSSSTWNNSGSLSDCFIYQEVKKIAKFKRSFLE